MKHFYDEETFYQVCKLSRKEFVDKLDKAKPEKVDKILDIVYKAEKPFGRRGVLNLN